MLQATLLFFHFMLETNKIFTWLETKEAVHMHCFYDSYTQHIISKGRFDMTTSLYTPFTNARLCQPSLPVVGRIYITRCLLFILCHLHSNLNLVNCFHDVLFRNQLNLTFKITLLKIYGITLCGCRSMFNHRDLKEKCQITLLVDTII